MRNALVAAVTALLVSVGVAGASSTSPFLQVCNQRTGPKESVGDLNVRLTTACAKGQHPFKLALYPVQAAQGPPGPKGDTGAQGPKGNTGATGDTGPQGSKGPRGPKGNNGENGSTGSRGPRGPKGPKGDKGDKGNKGDKGDRGPRGPAGPQGPPGPAGTMSCPSGSTLQKITVTTQGNAKGHEEIWTCVVG